MWEMWVHQSQIAALFLIYIENIPLNATIFILMAHEHYSTFYNVLLYRDHSPVM